MADQKEPTKRGRPVQNGVKRSERFTVRVTEKQLEQLDYWANKEGLNRSEFIAEAMDHYIAWCNSDYDLPTAEIARLNQMIGVVESLVATNRNLEATVISGFDSLIGLAKGDNYLIEDESGEL